MRLPAILRAIVAIAAAVATVATASPSRADAPVPGAPYASPWARPLCGGDAGAGRVCSARRPVCVQLAGTAAEAEAALDATERAWVGLVDALGLPAPRADGRLGGGPELDVYLVDERRARRESERDGGRCRFARPEAPLVVARDEPVPGALDGASAFALLDAGAVAGGGCATANLAARAVAGAILWRMEAAEGSGMRDGAAAYLADLVAPCAATGAPLVDDAQAYPERATLAWNAGAGASMLFAWWLDEQLAASPGALPIALRATTRQRTAPGSFVWQDEPDVLDGLRGALAARGGAGLSDVWIDFAVARAFLGSRDDGAHWSGGAWPGAAGRVRFDWSVPYGSLPRRLAAGRPVEPTGASYVWVDLDGAPPGARLALRAEWEAPVAFRWAAVRVGADGRELSRVTLPWQERGTSCEAVVDRLDGARGVLLVAANVGDPSLSRPYDLETGPFEPHAWTLTLGAP